MFYAVLLTLMSATVLSAFQFSGAVIESLLAACLLAATMPVNGVRSGPILAYKRHKAWGTLVSILQQWEL